MEITIIGNYGRGSSVSDGQTIKTRIVADIFENRYGVESVKRIDTYGGAKRIFGLSYEILRYGIKSKKLVFLTDAHGIWLIPFLVYIVKKLINIYCIKVLW